MESTVTCQAPDRRLGAGARRPLLAIPLEGPKQSRAAPQRAPAEQRRVLVVPVQRAGRRVQQPLEVAARQLPAEIELQLVVQDLRLRLATPGRCWWSDLVGVGLTPVIYKFLILRNHEKCKKVPSKTDKKNIFNSCGKKKTKQKTFNF